MDAQSVKTVIGETKSVCPECLKVISARKVDTGKGIYLEKRCEDHGEFRTLIWEGSRESYEKWGANIQPADRMVSAKPVKDGCPYDCGLCQAHERRGCCVLLELTTRCNLHCPVCFAEAGEGRGGDTPLEVLAEQMDILMSHGGPFNLQLSGGEPTVRDDLPEIIQMGKEKGFTFFQLNTNGLRLAEEDGYAAKLKKAGLSCVFLQFDGLNDQVYEILRGRPLLNIKRKAVKACEEAGLGVILVPVITPGVNEDQVGSILKFAISHMPAVRGVHFQPVSYFGRCVEALGSYRITIPKLLSLMEEQTEGMIAAEHFTGGNATNPYCTLQANYLRQPDGHMQPMLHGTARAYATSEQARKFVESQWQGATGSMDEKGCCCTEVPEQEQGCCCCEESTGGECCCTEAPEQKQGCCCGESTAQMQLDTSSLDEFLANLHNNTFAVSGMLFQDAWNLDLDRLKRCYILETDSRYGMVPFCAYNLTGKDGRSIYR